MSSPATATAATPSTVSQALRAIKRQKGRLAELTARASAVVSYEAGKKPSFDFSATRTEIGQARETLIRLESAVANANATTEVTWGDRAVTLSEAIRRLQECKAEIAWLSGLQLKSGSERHSEIDFDEDTGRNVRKQREVTYESCLTEPERVAQIEQLRLRFEELNDLVEAANHRTRIRLTPDTPPAT